MSVYLPPLLAPNGELNTVFNPHDFDYQNAPMSYNTADNIFTKKIDYNRKMLIDASLNSIEEDITNISYDASNNITNARYKCGFYFSR